MTRKQDREHAAKRDATELRLWLAMQEGTRCVCQHPQAFHCDGRAGEHHGECPVAECDCEAFVEDIFAGIPPSVKPGATSEGTDQDAWERAVLSETARANHDDKNAWDRTVTGTPNPSHKQSPSDWSAKRDPAVLGALRALSGDPKDLSAYTSLRSVPTSPPRRSRAAWLYMGAMRIPMSWRRSISAFGKLM
jgi:hypothetical protein